MFQLNSEKYFPKFKFEIQSEEYTIQQFKDLDCLEIRIYKLNAINANKFSRTMFITKFKLMALFGFDAIWAKVVL